MSITERLANLSIPSVLAIMAVLFALRFVLIRHKHPVAKSIAETAEQLAVALGLVFLLIRPFIVQAFFIPSESMLPGLRINDHILVNKFLYRFREPRLGDVIVFRAPIEATPDLRTLAMREAEEKGLEGKARTQFISRRAKKLEKDFIKRVIAVPGDTVRFTPGYVEVGDMRYNHEVLRQYLSDEGYARRVKLVEGGALADMRLLKPDDIRKALGQEGEKIRVVPGKVFVNGRAIREPYIAEDADLPYPLLSAGDHYEPTPGKWVTRDGGNYVVKVPKGKMLVVGDNRNDSFDARFWGLLDRERVLGKAMVRFWPLSRISLVR